MRFSACTVCVHKCASPYFERHSLEQDEFSPSACRRNIPGLRMTHMTARNIPSPTKDTAPPTIPDLTVALGDGALLCIVCIGVLSDMMFPGSVVLGPGTTSRVYVGAGV